MVLLSVLGLRSANYSEPENHKAIFGGATVAACDPTQDHTQLRPCAITAGFVDIFANSPRMCMAYGFLRRTAQPQVEVKLFASNGRKSENEDKTVAIQQTGRTSENVRNKYKGENFNYVARIGAAASSAIGVFYFRCFIAVSVNARPRWVRWRKPILSRYGSTTSTRVSTSSESVAAMASTPAGPPL